MWALGSAVFSHTDGIIEQSNFRLSAYDQDVPAPRGSFQASRHSLQDDSVLLFGQRLSVSETETIGPFTT